MVLLLHTGLVGDVVYHRPDLLYPDTPAAAALWLLAVCTVVSYLQAASIDPGWLRPQAGCACSSPMDCLLCPLTSVAACACGKCSQRLATAKPLEPPQAQELEPLGEDVESGAPRVVNGDAEGIQKRRAIAATGEETPVVVGAPTADFGTGPACEAAPQASRASQRRWCKRCQLYQPLRTKHCRDCGTCVRTHDHHCPWLGTCVGENNRPVFYCFLVFQSLELAAFFLEGVHGITILEPSIVLLMGLLLIAVFFIMVFCLLTFHSFLMLANMTTWEHISWTRISYLRPLASERGSPYSRSSWENVTAYCCAPAWCPERLRRCAALRRDEAGGVTWDLAEQRPPNCLIRCCMDNC